MGNAPKGGKRRLRRKERREKTVDGSVRDAATTRIATPGGRGSVGVPVGTGEVDRVRAELLVDLNVILKRFPRIHKDAARDGNDAVSSGTRKRVARDGLRRGKRGNLGFANEFRKRATRFLLEVFTVDQRGDKREIPFEISA